MKTLSVIAQVSQASIIHFQVSQKSSHSSPVSGRVAITCSRGSSEWVLSTADREMHSLSLKTHWQPKQRLWDAANQAVKLTVTSPFTASQDPRTGGLAHSVQLSKANVLCDKPNDFPLEHVFIWKFIASCVWEEENISKQMGQYFPHGRQNLALKQKYWRAINVKLINSLLGS